LRIISGIIRYDSGTIKIDDQNVENYDKFARKNISYVPETPILYETLTGNEYCDLYANARNADRDDYDERKTRIADALDLVEVMDRPIGMLSFGTKQKVSILAALSSDPQVLILDESLNGLDPTSIIVVKEIMREMVKAGHFVIFSTHLLDIAEIICQRVQILDSGKKVLDGNMDELKEDEENGFLEKLFLAITGKEDVLDKAKKLGDSLFQSDR
jgi:ABC-2 type transport system ATP-binding protein